MRELVDLLKVIADESRLKIIFALEKRNSCVCELASFLNLTQPTISSHLKQLRQSGIVDYKKDGKWVEYFLTENTPIRDLIAQLKLLIPGMNDLDNEINRIYSIHRNNLDKKC